jgi:dienelactone hydrolase
MVNAGGLIRRLFVIILIAVSLGFWHAAFGQVSERVVDIPTRPGVTQRFLLLTPEKPKADVVLFAGGDGGLEISLNGSIRFLNNNFLVRTRKLFANRGLAVAVIDAPSDHQRMALKEFRQKPEHVADINALIAWLKQQNNLPVWLVGTSRGTQSAAFIATELSVSQGGPDGLVLTSTILLDDKGRAVPEMPVEKIAIPVLVIHHEQDGCKHCPFSATSGLMKKLDRSPRKELITFRGGENRGDPCEALAYHGFNGLDKEVVGKIADWIIQNHP